jgi:hypothetical protein
VYFVNHQNIRLNLKYKISIESTEMGKEYDGSFVNLFLTVVFEVNELLGHSVTGSKPKKGNAKPKIEQNKYNLLKGKLKN